MTTQPVPPRVRKCGSKAGRSLALALADEAESLARGGSLTLAAACLVAQVHPAPHEALQRALRRASWGLILDSYRGLDGSYTAHQVMRDMGDAVAKLRAWRASLCTCAHKRPALTLIKGGQS